MQIYQLSYASTSTTLLSLFVNLVCQLHMWIFACLAVHLVVTF